MTGTRFLVMKTEHELGEEYIAGLIRARASFIALHQNIAVAHPEWVSSQDARTNLLAKPVNLILIAIVNLRVLQDVVSSIDFWRWRVDPLLNTPETIRPPSFEQGTFYRFGFIQFMLSNIEHGFRAIYARVVSDTDEPAHQAFAHVYSGLFRAVLTEDQAEAHTKLFDFLRLLRNTIHNNGVYYPVNKRDARFTIHGREYVLEFGKRVDVFGWEYFIEWLDPIRDALADVIDAPAVIKVDHISDIAATT